MPGPVSTEMGGQILVWEIYLGLINHPWVGTMSTDQKTIMLYSKEWRPQCPVGPQH